MFHSLLHFHDTCMSHWITLLVLDLLTQVTSQLRIHRFARADTTWLRLLTQNLHLRHISLSRCQIIPLNTWFHWSSLKKLPVMTNHQFASPIILMLKIYRHNKHTFYTQKRKHKLWFLIYASNWRQLSKPEIWALPLCLWINAYYIVSPVGWDWWPKSTPFGLVFGLSLMGYFGGNINPLTDLIFFVLF